MHKAPLLITATFAALMVTATGCRIIDSRPVFRYRSGPVSTLDPAAASDHASLREVARAYQSPMRLERTLGSIIPAPWILEGRPKVLDLGRRIELTFKKGIRFHESSLFEDDTREMTGCDWMKSILRHADPSVGSHWLAYLSSRIVGFREWAEVFRVRGSAAYDKTPRGLSCSENKATILLKAPDAEFSYFLSHPAASVLPADEILRDKWNVRDRPVGTGAFELSGARGSMLSWRSVDSVDPLKGIDVDTSKEAFRDWDLLIRGSLDVIELPRDLQSVVLRPDGSLAEKWKDQGFQLQRIQRADVVFIGFQMNDPFLSKKRGVRQALVKALSGDVVLDKVFAGRAIEARSALPPGLAGYQAAPLQASHSLDLAQAQDLLGFNGHPHGRGIPEFRMGCLAHPVEQELCRAVVARWELLGIRTVMLTMSEQERREGIRNGSVHFWPVTWVADLPASASYLEIFDPRSGIPEIPAPLGELAAFRKSLERARTVGGPQSASAISAAVSILNREAPAAFLVHRFQYWIVRPGIYGLNWQDFSWHAADELRKLDSKEN